jgi:hypothetical protein
MVENGEKPKRRRAPRPAAAEVGTPPPAVATEAAPKPKRVRAPRKPKTETEPES